MSASTTAAKCWLIALLCLSVSWVEAASAQQPPPEQAPPAQAPAPQAPPEQAPPAQAPPEQAPPAQATPEPAPPGEAPPEQAPPEVVPTEPPSHITIPRCGKGEHLQQGHCVHGQGARS